MHTSLGVCVCVCVCVIHQTIYIYIVYPDGIQPSNMKNKIIETFIEEDRGYKKY